MTDPARLLNTEIDGRSRRAMQAAISDEPPPGAKAELWRAITLALPAAGVLAGATTAASGVKAATLASSATAAAGTSAAASSTTAVSGATLVGTSAATAGTVVVGAGGLGVIAAKAVAVGLGIGLAINVTSSVAMHAVASKAAASAAAPSLREAVPVTRVTSVPVRPPMPMTTTEPAAVTAPIATTTTVARSLVPEPPTSDQLREESALLVRTRDALNASDAARALELIQDSRERFSGARLAQERDALEIQALVIAGETEQAVARARTFLARYPESPHAEKIRAIVRLH